MESKDMQHLARFCYTEFVELKMSLFAMTKLVVQILENQNVPVSEIQAMIAKLSVEAKSFAQEQVEAAYKAAEP